MECEHNKCKRCKKQEKKEALKDKKMANKIFGIAGTMFFLITLLLLLINITSNNAYNSLYLIITWIFLIRLLYLELTMEIK